MTPNDPQQRAPLAIPIWLDRGAAWSWRLLLIGMFGYFLLLVFSFVRIAVVPALIALIVASAIRPLTMRLGRLGMPAILATALPLLLIVGAVAGASWFVTQQTTAALDGDEFRPEQVRDEVEQWLMDGPFAFSEDEIEAAEDTIVERLVGGTKSWGASRGGAVLSFVGGAILTMVLTFLFIKDGPDMWRWAIQRTAPERRERVDEAGQAAAKAMAAYLRSVLLTGFVDALLIGAGLLILDVPLVIPLMIVTFIAALLPVVGAVAAGLAAAVVALIAVDPTTALWVIALTVLVQQIEGNIVMPMLIGRRVSIHPAVVLLSLTAGGAVAGLTGAFLAVPVVGGFSSAFAAFGSLSPTGADRLRVKPPGVTP